MFFFSSLRCGLLVHAICDKQDSLLRSAVNCTVAIIDRTAVVIDLFVENCDFCLPRLHSTPPLYRNIAVMFGAEKLKRCGYLKMKKMKIRLFLSTEYTNVTDGQTDRHRLTA